MPYDEFIRLPGGGGAFVRFSGKRPKGIPCQCGKRATLQCDWPVACGKTCDRYVCRACAGERNADGTDWCREHREAR